MTISETLSALIHHKQCLAIMGPTASGKSALSMALAQELPIEIISVDSALIYQGMDIGSAKPSQQELMMVPHHLIDIIAPDKSYSASDFVEDVHRLVSEVFSRGKLPVLVGGTMMYFNALQKGLNDLPSADEDIREQLQTLWQSSPEKLHQELSQVDPEAAQRIHPNDPQRLIRALEVYKLTGKSLSDHQKSQLEGLKDFELIKVALIPEDRAALHHQIEKRFVEMLESGFEQEVKSLRARGNLHKDMTSIRCVGYRQMWSYLEGEYEFDMMVHKGVVATRQLAKRQLTWLRKEEDILVMDPYQASRSELLATVLAHLKHCAHKR
jgi:tRNA dimethylallyltransferase